MSYARAGAKAGLLAAIISNVLLGLSSLYWKALDEMSPFALLSYRVVFFNGKCDVYFVGSKRA